MIDFILKKDINKLLSYIKIHWNKDHIFIKNIEVFKSQHDTQFDYYNFLSCTRNEEFTSILGVININKNSTNQIWLAIWHSLSGLDGYLLLNFILNKLKPDFVGVLGISSVAKKIYKLKDFEIGSLNHYYVSKPNSKLKLLNNKLINDNINDTYDLQECLKISTLQDLICDKYAPFKSPDYYVDRYQNNKFYNYKYLNIYNDKVLKIILVGRDVIVDDFKMFHCVDCIGDINNVKFRNLTQKFIIEKGYDIFELLFYSNDSINIDLFLKSNNEIIPSYFNPYVYKNINFDLAFKSTKKSVRFFIGDSDQDRPNN